MTKCRRADCRGTGNAARNSGIPATQALAAARKAHQGSQINEGTFKATFYKLANDGKKAVRRCKLGHIAGGGNHTDDVLKAGLTFIRLAGGVANVRERLAGLIELIETAKEVALRSTPSLRGSR